MLWADPDRVCAGRLRPALILLLLVCFAGLQTAAAITVHSHDHGNRSSDDCCAICHVGHLPAIEAAIAPETAPEAIVEWRCWREQPALAGDPSPVLNLSRAPPA